MSNNETETPAETSNQETTVQTQTESPDKDIKTITANLHILREQTKELEDMIHKLEDQFRHARGTGDVYEQAKAATTLAEVKPVFKREPRQRHQDPKNEVVNALRGVSLSINQVSKATGISVSRVADVIRALRVEHKIANVGSEDFPKWTYRIGDSAPPHELNSEVKRLIQERPMSTQELIEITGARLTRVSGALVALQRSENQLLNLGSQRRARWFLVGDNVVLAKLPPKGGHSNS